MFSCKLCPWQCSVDREQKFGVCQLPHQFLLSHVQVHHFEEPGLSGTKGSGAIFLTGCQSRCVFCQNYAISQPENWQQPGTCKVVSSAKLFQICKHLVEDEQVHNLNFVSPTPFSDLLVSFLKEYKQQLKVPLVWNSNGYERVETLKSLEGLVDIYLPDLKYFSDELALKYSSLKDYFKHASQALIEMQRQVGFPSFTPDGLISKGLIIRHLALPRQLEDSKKLLSWIYDAFGSEAYVALMAQYYPTYKASDYPEINRTLSPTEYAELSDFFQSLGFTNGLLQELSSADQAYTPEWNLQTISSYEKPRRE